MAWGEGEGSCVRVRQTVCAYQGKASKKFNVSVGVGKHHQPSAVWQVQVSQVSGVKKTKKKPFFF